MPNLTAPRLIEDIPQESPEMTALMEEIADTIAARGFAGQIAVSLDHQHEINPGTADQERTYRRFWSGRLYQITERVPVSELQGRPTSWSVTPDGDLKIITCCLGCTPRKRNIIWRCLRFVSSIFKKS